MSIKGNFTIKTSGVLLVFHNLMYSKFIGQVENFNPKNKEFFKGSNKNSKNRYWTYSKLAAKIPKPCCYFYFYLWPNVVLSSSIYITDLKQVVICKGV